MRLEELDYHLPEELIAQHPASPRQSSRLLVVNRSRASYQDCQFSELHALLHQSDVVVVNNTRVVPAKFFLRRSTGGLIEGLWHQTLSTGQWRVLLKGAGKIKVGEQLQFVKPDTISMTDWSACVDQRGTRGEHLLTVSPNCDAQTVLNQIGAVPLPPYIKRSDGVALFDDAACYQTVYARQRGAVAAPTAGLHFDRTILEQLKNQGILIVEITLHVGLGTFMPIEVENLADHTMHSEYYEISPDVWEIIQQAQKSDRRIVAVGTTTARTLETIGRHGLLKGQTNIFIYPPYQFQLVQAMITNFHLPRSTLLAMIYAFGGTELMRRVYQHAIEKRYRFFSYGDAMLIE